MLLFMHPRDGVQGDPAGMAEMKKLAGELASQGKLRRGAPLVADSAGARVRVHAGQALVSDGPFAESKELVGGFWIVEVASREEAVAIARACPHARGGPVEVRLLRARYTFPDAGKGTPFLLAFGVEPGLVDTDGAKFREMMAFGEGLQREGKLIETAPLALDVPPTRVEPHGANTLVTDGPFAEAKEMVGGYGLVRVADRAEAIELAKRYPHAKWGSIEVREIMFFDATGPRPGR